MRCLTRFPLRSLSNINERWFAGALLWLVGKCFALVHKARYLSHTIGVVIRMSLTDLLHIDSLKWGVRIYIEWNSHSSFWCVSNEKAMGNLSDAEYMRSSTTESELSGRWWVAVGSNVCIVIAAYRTPPSIRCGLQKSIVRNYTYIVFIYRYCWRLNLPKPATWIFFIHG